MANLEAYFQFEYFGQQYTKKQFHSLQSSFSLGYEHDEEYGKVICGNCNKTNHANRSGGFDSLLTIQEKIEPSTLDYDTPEYDFDEIISDDYLEIDDN